MRASIPLRLSNREGALVLLAVDNLLVLLQWMHASISLRLSNHGGAFVLLAVDNLLVLLQWMRASIPLCLSNALPEILPSLDAHILHFSGALFSHVLMSIKVICNLRLKIIVQAVSENQYSGSISFNSAHSEPPSSSTNGTQYARPGRGKYQKTCPRRF